MGNSVSRPSCLGQKSPRPEDAPKEPCSAASNNQEEEEEDGAGGSSEKASPGPRVVENGWTTAKSSPLPKQSHLDLKLPSCCPLQPRPEGAVAPWASPGSSGASWGWKLPTTREVTEVTEVTETVVTEILEVTEYPGGDRSRETSVAGMEKVLADVREAQAAALPGGTQGAGLTSEAAGKLAAWVSEVEDLMGHQKPPSGEAKVVKAQLQEQKLLLRLLGERTPHIGRLCQPLPAEPAGAAGGPEQPRGLASLREKWEILVQEAEARHSCLQQIVPAASLFQESVEAFQDWLSLTERKLAQLWGAPGSLARSQDAHQQIQDLRREVQSKPAELEETLEHGRRLLQLVPGEEGRLIQGQMDSLQLRLLLVEQRSSDALQPLEQTVEASSHQEPTQEGLDLGLQPSEKEQHLPGSQAEDDPCSRAPAGGEKVRGVSLEAAGLVQWLEQVELQLFSSKPMWGHSEETKEKLAPLSRGEQQRKNPAPLRRGTPIQDKSRPGPPPSPRSPLQEQKEQLLQSPNMATKHHASLQGLLRWAKPTEEALEALPPPSYILDSKQRRRQQTSAQGREAQSKKLAGTEAGAAFLTQDNGGDTKERLAQVLQQAGERGDVLEEAHQQAKQFGGSWRLLLKWMGGWEAACPAPAEAPPAKPEDLKALLGQPGFQRLLWAKRPVFEATLQQGALRSGQAFLPADGQELEAMHRELKEHWGALWSRAAERQQKLEGHLLFSGCFGDALQGLLDWLCRAKPQLAEETPVSGDRDCTLMGQHKAFQTELGRRAVAVTSLRCSAHVLLQGGNSVDAQWLQIQTEELEDRWELLGQLSVSQQSRLEVALRQAEEFHRLLSAFLSRLSGLEKQIMDGAPPEEEEEEEAGRAKGQSQLEEMQQSIQWQQLELDCISSLGKEILSTCHPDAVGTVQSWVTLAKTRFQQLCSRVQQQEQRLKGQAASLAANQEEAERLSAWITAAQESLRLRDQEPLPEDNRQLEEIGCQHVVFMRELDHKQAEVEKVATSGRRRRAAQVGLAPSSSQQPPEVSLVDISSLEAPQENKPGWNRLSGWVPAMPEDGLDGRRAPLPPDWHGARRALPRPSSMPLEDLQPQDPLLAELVRRWQWLWVAAQERQHRLQSAQRRLQELEEMAGFNFAAWRKRFLQWIGHRKSRVVDIFRSIDQGQDGRITRQEFIRRVLASKFPTSLPEMTAVAKIFDVNRDGFIDYYGFISALHPSRDILHRVANVDHIQEEVNRQVAECNCVKRFQVEQISGSRYRFGECQQLRMVRILRSTLMVRVGGGWTALDEFLVKNDPCRVKGRTNLKINERYLSPGLLGRKGAGSQSAPASKILSPSGSTSSLTLYSSASAPSSPVPRKAVLRWTRSGDRCLHSCSPAGATGRAEPDFAAGVAGPGAEPPGHPRREASPGHLPAP